MGRAWIPWLAGGLLGVGTLAWLLWPRVEERPPWERPSDWEEFDPDQTAVGLKLPPRTALTGAEMIGINEGVGIGERSENLALGGLDSIEGRLTRRARMVKGLGVELVRGNSHALPRLNVAELQSTDWNFDKADLWFRSVGRLGLHPVVVVGPWPGARTPSYTEHYVPADLEAYELGIERMVERYDGDGIDDMEGLQVRVLAWELDNEPDLHFEQAKRGEAAAGFQSPEEYAQVLQITARAIRKADPEATILLGGMYRTASPSGEAYLRDLLLIPGVRESFDAMSLHIYFDRDDLTVPRRVMETARALAPDTPLWITETSVPSAESGPHVNEDWHAGMVAALVGVLLAEGADRIFWHSLVDPPVRVEGNPRGFGSNSLIRLEAEGRNLIGQHSDKPGAEVMRNLVRFLGPATTASMREVEAEGGRLLATDQGWLAFWGEPALPPGAGEVTDLRTGTVARKGATARAPAWISR